MAEVTNVPSRFPVIRPEMLGRMQVLETISTEDIIAARMAKFVEYWAASDPPSAAQYDVGGLEFDPIKILEELSTYFELMLRDRVNQAARSVTLAFATGTDLDAIASRYPGGVPRLPSEPYTLAGDDAYRRRVWLSPNLLSPHGSYEAYIFWALSASAGLRDASALTVPGTGVVDLYIMSDDGNPSTHTILPTSQSTYRTVYGGSPVPSADQIATVFRYISDKSRKGLTDVLRVLSAKVSHVTIDVDIWLFPGVDKATKIAEVQAALISMVANNRWIGTDTTLMAINGCLAQNGVYDAVINSPKADVIVGRDACVKVDGINLTYRGTGE